MKSLFTSCVLCLLVSSRIFGQTLVEKSIKLFDEGRRAEAGRLFSQSVKDNPKNDTAYYYLGILAINSDYDKAIGYLTKAISLKPEDAKYHFMLGNAYGVKAQKAGIFSKFGAAMDCLKEFRTASSLDPKYIDARRGLVEYYLQAPGIMGGSVDKAIAQSDTIMGLDPYAGYLTKASIYRYQKKKKEEEESYLRAITTSPGKTQAYWDLWRFYMGDKEDSKADQLLARALKAVKDKSDIYFWAGLYYVQENNLVKAKDLFDHALMEDSANAPVYYQLGKVALLSGKDLDKGLNAFRKYLAMPLARNAPDYAYAHWRMGLIYEKLGKMDSARIEFLKSLKLNPDLQESKKALAKLK